MQPIATKPVPPREGATGPRALVLEIADGPNRGQRFTDLPARCAIGSHPTNVVVLDDPTVSRFHCEIVVGDGVVRILDRSSLNGTRIDHVQIEKAVLHGDV